MAQWSPFKSPAPLILQSTDTVFFQDSLKLSLAMKGRIIWQHINGRDELPELAILWALRNVRFSCWKSLFPLQFTWTQWLGFGLILWKQEENKHLRVVSPQTHSYQNPVSASAAGEQSHVQGSSLAVCPSLPVYISVWDSTGRYWTNPLLCQLQDEHMVEMIMNPFPRPVFS